MDRPSLINVEMLNDESEDDGEQNAEVMLSQSKELFDNTEMSKKPTPSVTTLSKKDVIKETKRKKKKRTLPKSFYDSDEDKKKKTKRKKTKKKPAKKRKRKDEKSDDGGDNLPLSKRRKTKSSKPKKPKTPPLDGVKICISGIGNPQRRDLRERAKTLGATYCHDFSPVVTHVIVPIDSDETFNTPKTQKAKKANVPVVSAEWLTDCYAKTRKYATRRYDIYKKTKKKKKKGGYDDESSGDELDEYERDFIDDPVIDENPHSSFRPKRGDISDDDLEFVKNVDVITIEDEPDTTTTEEEGEDNFAKKKKKKVVSEEVILTGDLSFNPDEKKNRNPSGIPIFKLPTIPGNPAEKRKKKKKKKKKRKPVESNSVRGITDERVEEIKLTIQSLTTEIISKQICGKSNVRGFILNLFDETEKFVKEEDDGFKIYDSAKISNVPNCIKECLRISQNEDIVVALRKCKKEYEIVFTHLRTDDAPVKKLPTLFSGFVFFYDADLPPKVTKSLTKTIYYLNGTVSKGFDEGKVTHVLIPEIGKDRKRKDVYVNKYNRLRGKIKVFERTFVETCKKKNRIINDKVYTIFDK